MNTPTRDFTVQQLGSALEPDGGLGEGRECSPVMTVAILPLRCITDLNQPNKHQENGITDCWQGRSDAISDGSDGKLGGDLELQGLMHKETPQEIVPQSDGPAQKHTHNER